MMTFDFSKNSLTDSSLESSLSLWKDSTTLPTCSSNSLEAISNLISGHLSKIYWSTPLKLALSLLRGSSALSTMMSTCLLDKQYMILSRSCWLIISYSSWLSSGSLSLPLIWLGPAVLAFVLFSSWPWFYSAACTPISFRFLRSSRGSWSFIFYRICEINMLLWYLLLMEM